MAIQNSPPWIPFFGIGAPSGAIPITSPYFDTSTNPYTPYIYDHTATAWKKYGVAAAGSGNAQSIQGIPVSATPPLNGQVLSYNATSLQYEPKSPSGGVQPSIVQFTNTNFQTINNGISFAVAPTQGNLLIAFIMGGPAAITANAGWTRIFNTTNCSIFMKIAGASEPTLQVPGSSASGGATAIYEVANACAGQSVQGANITAQNPVTTNVFIQKGNGGFFLAAFCGSATQTPLSATGFVLDQISGGSRVISSGHLSNALGGNNAIGLTFSAAASGFIASVELG